jgi:hypothetical protein
MLHSWCCCGSQSHQRYGWIPVTTQQAVFGEHLSQFMKVLLHILHGVEIYEAAQALQLMARALCIQKIGHAVQQSKQKRKSHGAAQYTAAFL